MTVSALVYGHFPYDFLTEIVCVNISGGIPFALREFTLVDKISLES